MSLTIRDALYKLAEKLNVDTSGMPTSNIADSIDYITEQTGGTRTGTGVIATAVDAYADNSGEEEEGPQT